ncbi:MAG TPA: molybdopterin cofactor-binding domain-containing protein [Kofleriaceae bacterium]
MRHVRAHSRRDPQGGDEAVIVTRRAFLMSSAAGALIIRARLGFADGVAAESRLDPWVAIHADGSVAITCHRSEMGQGIRSSIPVLIADELGAALDDVRVLQGDGDPRYGNQDTDGSTSIRNFFDALREAGAVARTMLIDAAAARWHVPAKRLVAAASRVTDPITHKALSFGELAHAAASQPVPKHVALRPIGELVHVGTDLPLYDAAAYVTGTAPYAADIRLPGMLVAAIARPPDLFGTIARVDDSKAKAIAGVKLVTQLAAPSPPASSQPLGGVAVIATTTWAALKGRAALEIEWAGGPNNAYDSADYEAALLAAVRAPGDVVRHVGDAYGAIATATSTISAEYIVPHLAHAPMEPLAALANVTGARVEVWACTQDPQDAVAEVAKALGIPNDHVTLHVTFLGGGFGRKSNPDFIVEAALLSKAAQAPVRVQWTRTDELHHSYYHTHSAQALTAGLDASNHVIAWRHRVAYPSISATFKDGVDHPSGGELGQGLLDLPLAIPNVRIETGAAPAHVRIGWMRSVCNVQQAFAVQSFIAELAHATKRDPRDMLLELLGPPRVIDEAAQGVDKITNYGAPLAKHPIELERYRNVIDRVTSAAGWGKRSDLGLAVHRSFLSYIAVVAAADARGRITEAWIAVDAGLIVNADRVRSQMEGAFVFAMSSAMHGELTWKHGATVQTNFHDYRLVRMPEAPRKIHVEIVRSDRPPGGVGEPGVPAVAPAIANAIFATTGKRIRRFPFARELAELA